MSLNIGAIKVQAFQHCRNTFAKTTSKRIQKKPYKLTQPKQTQQKLIISVLLNKIKG